MDRYVLPRAEVAFRDPPRGHSPRDPELPVVAETGYGLVAGERRPAGVVYRSIPYAGPMAGGARFAAPAPPRPWTGLRRAPLRAPTAPAAHRPRIGALDITPLIGTGWTGGQEYLTLTVSTPVAPGANAPVLVFVHGGGFVSGSHTADVLNGDAFMDSGVVLVTITYRLGIAGWLDLPGAPANRGLLDVIAALRWVREEIHAFGGDPGRVTVAGQSAGAMIVAALLASPAARGLFQRAVSASGNAENAISPDVAARVTAALAGHLGETDVRRYSQIPDDALVEAAGQLSGVDFGFPGRPPALPAAFALVLDTDTLPQRPAEAVAAQDGWPVDLLVGCTSEEANLYLVPTGVLSRVTQADVDALARRLGVSAVELDAANRRDPADGPAQILARATTEALFAGATRRLADAHAAARRGRTFCYEFAWRSDAFAGDLGACHCGDLPWIFRTTGVPALNGSQSLLGTNPPDAGPVRRVHEAWAGFVRDGDPGWPQHRPTAPHLELFR